MCFWAQQAHEADTNTMAHSGCVQTPATSATALQAVLLALSCTPHQLFWWVLLNTRAPNTPTWPIPTHGQTYLGLVKVLSQFLPVCGWPLYLHSVSCSYTSCTHS